MIEVQVEEDIQLLMKQRDEKIQLIQQLNTQIIAINGIVNYLKAKLENHILSQKEIDLDKKPE